MEQKKIWDYFQVDPLARKVFEGALPRYQALSKEVLSGNKVLNIGVGSGGLENILAEKKIQVFSLDPSDGAIALVREKLPIPEQAKVGKSDCIPWEDSFFDVVIMSEVLEHLGDDDYYRTFQEVSRVLRPGGKFVFTVPAEEDLLKNNVICPSCGEKFHRWGHVRSFDALKIQSDIVPLFCNMQLLRRNYSDFSLLNWKGKLAWLVKRLLSVTGLQGSEDTFFVVVQKVK